jgi:hypothetical protein
MRLNFNTMTTLSDLEERRQARLAVRDTAFAEAAHGEGPRYADAT